MVVKSISKTSEPYVKQGYSIIEPPIEFKGRFEMDINAALMNIAGISISNSTRFITYDNLAKNYMGMHQPFQANVLTIGTKDSLRISDFFLPELIPYEIYSKPLFIHFDCSVTGDRTGIACAAAMGYKYQNEYDIASGAVVPTKQLVYRQLFTIGIQCPPGAEISFQKSRDFIYYLRNVLHWNIKAISCDGFQSVDMRQQFVTMGFDDTTLVSLDKKPDGYLALKSAINEQRIKLYNIDELQTELINLQQDNQTGKVDHTPEFSKDMSDALAGAIFNASLHDKDFSFDLIDGAEIFDNVNNKDNFSDDRERLLRVMSPQYNSNYANDQTILDTSDYAPQDSMLDQLQKQNPEMSLGDAVAMYIKEKKDNMDQNNSFNNYQQPLSNTSGGNYNYEREMERLRKDQYDSIGDLNDGFLLF